MKRCYCCNRPLLKAHNTIVFSKTPFPLCLPCYELHTEETARAIKYMQTARR